MNLTFHEAYWDNKKLKAEFIRFLTHIHNLDLTRWESLGYWDNNYRPFSYFNNDTLVSSVCLYSMDMVVNNKPTKVAQISGVGTLEKYRRRGLSRQLSDKAINWAKETHDFFYLFSDPDARPLYEKLGFRPVQESLPFINISGSKPDGTLSKLNIENSEQRNLVYNLAKIRTTVSNLLGVLNPKLLIFWALYSFQNNIYHIPEHNLIIIYKRENTVVTIYDIIAESIPPFNQLYPYIADQSDTKVQFRFLPDKLNLQNIQYQPLPDNNGTHLLGNFPLENQPLMFPITSMA